MQHLRQGRKIYWRQASKRSLAGGSFFKDGTTLIKIVEPPDPARLLGLKADRPDPKPAEAATGQPGKKTAPERFEDSVADAVNSMIPHVERLVES